MQMFPRRLIPASIRGLATLRDRARIKIAPENLYEPRFEDPREFPELPPVILRLRGYDYVPLEKFQSYVHRICRRLNLLVKDSYAVAAETERVVLYKPGSTVVDSEIALCTYERVLLIAALPGVRLPVLISLIETHLPIGVRVTVARETKEDETRRYIPDLLLKAKQDELKALDDPVTRKKLGWE